MIGNCLYQLKTSVAAVGLAVLAVGSAGTASATDLRTVSEFLASWEETRGVTNVCLYTQDEAIGLMDSVFARGDDTNGVKRLPALKRRIAENLAFVYSYEMTDETNMVHFACQEKIFREGFARSLYGGETAFSPRVSCCSIVHHDRSKDKVIGPWETPREEVFELPFVLRRLETRIATLEADGDDEQEEPIWVIADVEDVSFAMLTNLNFTAVKADRKERSFTLDGPKARYRVELIVRKAKESEFPYDRLVFLADKDSLYDLRLSEWPFFRGVTLRVALARGKKGLEVVSARPALPYPPFSTDGVEIVTDLRRNRFALSPKVDARRPKEAVASLAIAYGEHTVARFCSYENDITGTFGAFPDYTRTVETEVWAARQGANPEWWRETWFEKVTVLTPEDDLQGRVLLDFSWRAFRRRCSYARSRVASCRTLGAVLDVIAEVTQEGGYRLSADEALRTRSVALEEKLLSYDLTPYTLLELVCEQTGCSFDVQDDCVVLAADFSAAEVADKSLAGRLHRLERIGFASVVGTDYVSAGFWKLGLPYGCERPIVDLCELPKSGLYQLTGGAWTRQSAEGARQVLAFDAVWWPAGEFSVKQGKTRLARDAARMRAFVRDRQESETEHACTLCWRELDALRTALAFALHLQQLGRTEEAAAIYAELEKDPTALEMAFAKLCWSVKLATRDFATPESWAKSIGLEKPQAKGVKDDDDED